MVLIHFRIREEETKYLVGSFFILNLLVDFMNPFFFLKFYPPLLCFGFLWVALSSFDWRALLRFLLQNYDTHRGGEECLTKER